MVRGHEITCAPTLLHVTQPAVARASCDRLGSIRAKTQLAELEGESVMLRESLDRLSDRPTVRPNLMVRVRDDERQASRGGELVHQVEQRDRVGAARDTDQRRPGRREEPEPRDVCGEAVDQRGHD